jgi:hypothetical protein
LFAETAKVGARRSIELRLTHPNPPPSDGSANADRHLPTDDEMHAFLKVACGVENCGITASTLFAAATSSMPTVCVCVCVCVCVWPSARAELKLDIQAGLLTEPSYFEILNFEIFGS